MKKIRLIAQVLVFVLVLSACGTDAKPTRLGTSAFSIVLPDGYAFADDEFDEDQVAYYYKDDNSFVLMFTSGKRVTGTRWNRKQMLLPMSMALCRNPL